MASDDSATIAVMGATGAGKSSFINRASSSDLKVGEGLMSCTSEVQVAAPFILDGKMVTLVDTPGFDDTVKTEADILKLIVDFFAATYEQGRKLNGIVFLHRITENRMGGVASKNFRLFRKLCGDATLKGVVVATSMWDDVSAELGERRERELAENPLFFQPALAKGARLMRHDGTPASAHHILRGIMGRAPAGLQVQIETVDEAKRLAQTEVGQDLTAALEAQIARHREEVDALRGEARLLMDGHDAAHQAELEELSGALAEAQDRLRRAEDEARRLREEQEETLRVHAEKVRGMAQAMEEREAELRTSRSLTRQQTAKAEELEGQARLLAEAAAAREEELRAARAHTRQQTAKADELEAALQEAARKAAEEERRRAVAAEERRLAEAAHRKEVEKTERLYEERLEAQREAQRREEAERKKLRFEAEQRQALLRVAAQREERRREAARQEELRREAERRAAEKLQEAMRRAAAQRAEEAMRQAAAQLAEEAMRQAAAQRAEEAMRQAAAQRAEEAMRRAAAQRAEEARRQAENQAREAEKRKREAESGWCTFQ